MKLSSLEIRNYIQNKIINHFNGGGVFIDIISGDIQKELGIIDATPQVCSGMQKVADNCPHLIIRKPYKGMGTRLIIRYYKDNISKTSDVKIETIIGEPKGRTGSNTHICTIRQIPIIDKEHIETATLNFFNEIIKDPNGRFKSWEHCYNFFKKNRTKRDSDTLDRMSLHLAFYLASWGMLRGSSFLLKKDYLVHLPAISIISENKYARLWNLESTTIDLIIECGERVAESYKQQANCKKPSETLLTKILLGVFGCIPAYDRYFKLGLKKYELTATYGKRSLLELIQFYKQHKEAFEACKEKILIYGADYTPMKLIDMFFWEEGINEAKITHEEAITES